MIIHYLYENPLEPINPVDIKRELLELDKLFSEAERENSQSLRNILERYKRKINDDDDDDDSNSSGKNSNQSDTETAKFIQFFSASYSKK